MRILVADDESSVRILLRGTLEKWGYEVIDTGSGAAALDVLQEDDPPRLAVIDWVMPDLDGVEICRRLQQSRERLSTYVVLLTSKAEKGDLVYALDNGAHDFLTKPVYPEELRSRLAVGRRLVEAEDRLAELASSMEALAEERARQLVHAERLATLGTLSAGVAHEINNPVGFISGNSQLLQMHVDRVLKPVLDEAIERGSTVKAGLLEHVRDELPETIRGIDEGVERINGIVASLRRFSRKDGADRSAKNVNDLVENALLLCNNALKYHARVDRELGEGLPDLLVHPQRIEQVLVNLISNAADAIESAGRGTLAVRTARRGDAVEIAIEDTGPGLPEEMLARIWEPFYTTKGEEQGTGLGLSIAKGIVEEHGGTLAAENRQGGGARFVVTLPLEAAGTPTA